MTVRWRTLLTVRHPGQAAPDTAGLVAIRDGAAEFIGSADSVFAALRERHGDLGAAELLLDQGWSNGVGTMFLGPLKPGT